MFRDIDEAFAWIESFTNLEKSTKDLKRRYRPERMQVLLEQFGNPQNHFKVIHTAGSKGKGSVCALLASALKEAGFNTGLYSSPHVLHYRERIRVNGVSLPDESYIRMITSIHDSLGDLPGATDPTTFELLTLLGFLLFREEACEWAVIETGLGGRLDATNTVIPEAVVLTPVELEHTQWLGNSLKEIATEKAGIMKKGKPVFSSEQQNEVAAVFRDRAQKTESKILFLEDRIRKIDFKQEPGISSYTWYYRDGHVLSGELTLSGRIQAWNAALALEVLVSLYPDRDRTVWLKGFKKAQLPARMQLLSSSPLRILDGSHTPRSTTLALESFFSMSSQERDKILLFACQDDKDINELARLLAPEFSEIVITTPGFFKKSDPDMVYQTFLKYSRKCRLERDPAAAYDLAMRTDKDLLIMGSFFLAGEILKIIGEKT